MTDRRWMWRAMAAGHGCGPVPGTGPPCARSANPTRECVGAPVAGLFAIAKELPTRQHSRISVRWPIAVDRRSRGTRFADGAPEDRSPVGFRARFSILPVERPTASID